MLSFTVRQTIAIYYFTYNLGRPDLIGLFFGMGLMVMFVGLPFAAHFLAARFGKAGAIQVGSLFTIFLLYRLLPNARRRGRLDCFLGLHGSAWERP